ncbi:carbon-nitrogen hydrolase family protein [Hydrogenimonas sp. SS33]|uniref:carbon-nitrogen hydrolase family protein n=1 Tax=Hydrogenimonas leucolamina TaxID=2954236 RepID=UPI00336BD7B4
MKITLAQISVAASIQLNLQKIIKIIQEHKTNNLIIFPELALTSYNLEYITSLNQQIIDEALDKIQLQLSSHDQTVIVGTSRYNNEGNIYNSAAIITTQNILYYDKINLTKKDRSLFTPGKKMQTVDIESYRIGTIICRDQNDIELIQNYKKRKIDVMVQLSAHYYETEISLKKIDKNIAMPIARAIDCSCTWIKVNTVGQFENEMSLGNSMIVSPIGEVLRQGNKFTEEIITFTT